MKQGIQRQCSWTTQRDGVEKEVGGVFRIGETHVYLWPIHVDIWQKKSQDCKVIILELNKLIKERKQWQTNKIHKPPETKSESLEDGPRFHREPGNMSQIIQIIQFKIMIILNIFPNIALFFPPSQGILIAFSPNPWGQGQWKKTYGKLD